MKTTITTTLILLAFLVSTSVNAQNPLTFGVKAGVNLADFSKDIEDNKMKVGFNAGVTADYKLNKNFFLLSAFEVVSKGTRVKSEYMMPTILPIPDNNTYSFKQNYNPIYLQIPVHAGYKVFAADNMVIVFHAGPFVSYGVGGKISSTSKFHDGREEKTKLNAFGSNGLLKKWDMGMGLGAGAEFKSIGVNFGYDLGILNVSKVNDTSIKTNTAHVSLSYRLQ